MEAYRICYHPPSSHRCVVCLVGMWRYFRPSLDGFGVSMYPLGCEWSHATTLRNGLLQQQCLATRKAIRIGQKYYTSRTYSWGG